MSQNLPLRGIDLPDPIGLWPPAPGWWLMMAILLAILIWSFWWRLRSPSLGARVQSQYGLQELDRIEKRYANDPHALAKAVSILLRRMAITKYGRQRVAGLTGERWLKFLDEQQDHPIFSRQFHDDLLAAPYQPKAQLEIQPLLQAVRAWLEQQTIVDQQR